MDKLVEKFPWEGINTWVLAHASQAEAQAALKWVGVCFLSGLMALILALVGTAFWAWVTGRLD